MANAVPVLLLADLEGASGFTGWHTPEAEFSGLIARDVNAAVRGLIRAGASEVDVIDAHGSGANLAHGDVAGPAQLLGGSLALAQLLLNGSRMRDYAAWAVVGQHAMPGSQDAFMAHANAGQLVGQVTMNGRPIGEIAEWAWLAGSFGRPLVALSGDRAACLEAEEFVPGVATATVKVARDTTLISRLEPAEADRAIEEAFCRGMTNIGRISPAVLAGPVRMQVTFKLPRVIPMAAVLPRSVVSGDTLTYVAKDYNEALQAYLSTVVLAGSALAG